MHDPGQRHDEVGTSHVCPEPSTVDDGALATSGACPRARSDLTQYPTTAESRAARSQRRHSGGSAEGLPTAQVHNEPTRRHDEGPRRCRSPSRDDSEAGIRKSPTCESEDEGYRFSQKDAVFMALSLAQTVRCLLANSPGESLCDSCLAFACEASLLEIRDVTAALVVAEPSIRHSTSCASCRRTVSAIVSEAAVLKCPHCSRPLDEGAAGVMIEGERFHDACLRRLISDETIRVSRALTRRSRELIERSRQRLRERHGSPPIKDSA